MQGPSTTDENLRGVIPNSFLHIFQFVKSTKDIEFLIRCSYLELYNEEIRDLLGNPKAPQKCELKEDPNKGIYVKGMTDVVVESPEDLNRMFDKGLTNRTVASTLMNSESSRSHSIFTIVIEMNTKDPNTGKDMLRVGKLNLVDLAGSERAKKTGAQDKTLKEGIKINLSLSVLGNVISALSEGAKHIPYRDSKLTRLLQDSLGGNTKTMMVAAISPADYNFDETLSTLRYANRTKNIKNKPKINEDPKDTMIREFKAEIERLKKLLMDQAGAAQILAQLAPEMMQAPQALSVSSSQPAIAAVSVSQSQSQRVDEEPSGREEVLLSVSASQSSVRERESSAERSDSGAAAVDEPLAAVLLIDEAQQTSLKIDNEPVVVVARRNEETETEIETETQSQVVVAAAQEENASEPTPNQSVRAAQPTVEVEAAQTSAKTAAPPSLSDSPQKESSQVDEGEDDYADAAFESTGEFPSSPIKAPKTPPQDFMNNPALDEQLRNEVANRLSQLQHMLMANHTESSLSPSIKHALSPIKEVLGSTVGSIDDNAPVKTAEQIAEEEEEAARVYRERKLKAKKKRDEKQQREMQRILDEKKQVEDELEELRQSTQNNPNGAAAQSVATSRDVELSEENNDAYSKKLNKIKKKYEKKMQSMTEEMREMRDEFEYQRKQLLDNVLEQEKDLKLYELICKTILSEKDLKRILDKSRYDEDEDEWVIPFVKKRPVEVSDGAPTSNNSSFYQAGNSGGSRVSSANNDNFGGGGGGGGLLPDIHNSKLREKEIDKLDQTMRFPVAAPPFGSTTNGSRNARNRSGNAAAENPTALSERKPVVPLLTLPGHLITASSLLEDDNVPMRVNAVSNKSVPPVASQRSARSARSESDFPVSGRDAALPGIGFAELPADKRKRLPGLGTETTNGSAPSLVEKERVAKNKIPKVPMSSNTSTLLHNNSSHGRMPQINGSAHGKPSSSSQQESPNNYSDDEDVLDMAPSSARNAQKKKKKVKDVQQSRSHRDHDNGRDGGSARGGGLPPIDLKNGTPRVGSLPPI